MDYLNSVKMWNKFLCEQKAKIPRAGGWGGAWERRGKLKVWGWHSADQRRIFHSFPALRVKTPWKGHSPLPYYGDAVWAGGTTFLTNRGGQPGFFGGVLQAFFVALEPLPALDYTADSHKTLWGLLLFWRSSPYLVFERWFFPGIYNLPIVLEQEGAVNEGTTASLKQRQKMCM